MADCFEGIGIRASAASTSRPMGRVAQVHGPYLRLTGFGENAAIGDHVEVRGRRGLVLRGEIVRLCEGGVDVLADGATEGIGLGAVATLTGPTRLAPHDSWIGRVIDPDGRPLDGRPLLPGPRPIDLRRAPPSAATRRGLGERLETGIAVLNTMLPLVRGQRMGMFAGSGVGKSRLLATLARRMQADVVVVALIGERGREVGEFVNTVLGPEGLTRSVVVAAPSDQPALTRRRCAWSAMAVAEHFRDEGRQVLLLADSITRFAEAHRDAALAAGETAALDGFPSTVTHQIMGLCERAGPGGEGVGDITAIFTVLVSGSDMEGLVADTLRGVLDGHVVLSRPIAERGRYPAIDVLKSVSRSLPAAATHDENAMIAEARKMFARYDEAELMIQSGLYTRGNDSETDRAIALRDKLEAFLAEDAAVTVEESFTALGAVLSSA